MLLYPDDARVQEQIATTLVEEGQFDQALPRLEKLAAATDDKYRQATYRVEAAELKVKLKKTSAALAPIPGQVPSTLNRPPGCIFSSRCSYADPPRCTTVPIPTITMPGAAPSAPLISKSSA